MGKQRRLIVIGLGLGLLAFVVVLLLSDVSQLLHFAQIFPWLMMIPVMGLRLINWFLRFLKWHFYLRLVGVRNISAADSATVFVSGFPMSLSPGKAAELLKSFILYGMTGAPVASTLPVVASERLSDGMAVLLLIVLGIFGLSANQYWAAVYIPMGLMVTGITILQIRPLCMALLRALGKLPLVGRYARHFALFYESSYKIVLLPNLALAVSLGLVANILDGVGVYLILVGMGQPANATTFYQALLVISLSVVTGSLSAMPGSIGAADLTIGGSLVGLVKLSVSEAGFATLLIRFVQLWMGVIVGSAVLFLARKRLFPPNWGAIIAEHEKARSEPTTEAEIVEPVSPRALPQME